MQQWVREKLKQIDELYPSERLEASKARWRAMWEGRTPTDRYPFQFGSIGFNYYNESFSKEDGLRAYLDEIINRGFVQDDFIPAFFPGCHQGTIPAMLGAKEIVVGYDHSNERILFKPEDIDNLPEPSILPGTSGWRWLEMQRYYVEECEGVLPVHVCDMQGPVDVAAQLFGYDNLFLCAYDDEDRYNALMRKVCDAYCILWEAQAKALGNLFIGTHLFGWNWVPPSNGASLSADSMAMVSGNFFEEFYSPHLATVAERLGKLSVHSCGNFTAVIPTLGALPFVHAVNASQLSLEEILEAGWPRKKMVILMENIADAECVFARAKSEGLSVDVTYNGLWPTDSGGNQIPPHEWDSALREKIICRADEVTQAARIGDS
ncbi:MAG: hypothetical protein ACK5LX_11395 [Oscillospiraceae bacterium]